MCPVSFEMIIIAINVPFYVEEKYFRVFLISGDRQMSRRKILSDIIMTEQCNCCK